jgi:hypothetical protein
VAPISLWRGRILEPATNGLPNNCAQVSSMLPVFACAVIELAASGLD